MSISKEFMMQNQQHRQCEFKHNFTTMVVHLISENLIVYLPVDLNKDLFLCILYDKCIFL